MMTEQEILEDLKNTKLISDEDLEYIKNSDPIDLHHGFGTWVRNYYNIWKVKWEPEIKDGVDYSLHHPDAISNRIVQEFVKYLNQRELS